LHGDSLSKKWRVFQSVVVKLLITPLGSKTCYIDLGVRNLATVWLPEWRQPVAYQSGRLLADWWYWNNRIALLQNTRPVLYPATDAGHTRSNRRDRSKRLSGLFLLPVLLGKGGGSRDDGNVLCLFGIRRVSAERCVRFRHPSRDEAGSNFAHICRSTGLMGSAPLGTAVDHPGIARI